MNTLIKALENYIEFLEEEIDNKATILHVHGVKWSPEVIKRGEELRLTIIKEKEKIENWHDCAELPFLNNYGTSEIIEIELIPLIERGWYDKQWGWVDVTGKKITNPNRWRETK